MDDGPDRHRSSSAIRCARGARASALARATSRIGRAPVSVMHVCGSHEQAIAKFGSARRCPRDLERHHGAGLSGLHHRPARDRRRRRARAAGRPHRHLRRHGARARHAPGRWPTRRPPARASTSSTASRRRSSSRATRTTRSCSSRPASRRPPSRPRPSLLAGVPPNFSVLSAHKYIPPVMEIVAEMPGTRVEGFLAAGHAATITGWGIFEPFVARHRLPVVVAGFEPLDILAALVRLVELVRDGQPRGRQHVPALRHARRQPQRAADSCGTVFRPIGGRWRGIAHVPNGNLRLRDEWAHVDARRRFRIDVARAVAARAVDARAPVHLRQHHGRHRVAGRLPAVRRRVRARRAGRRVHGQQRRHLPHLARVRRRAEPRRSWHVQSDGSRRAHPAEARRRRPRDAPADRGGVPRRVRDRSGVPAGCIGVGRDGRRRRGAHRRSLAGADHRLARDPAGRSFRAATSAGWRSAARSTTSR